MRQVLPSLITDGSAYPVAGTIIGLPGLLTQVKPSVDLAMPTFCGFPEPPKPEYHM